MKPPDIKPTDSDTDDDLLPFSPEEEATMRDEIDLAMQSYAGIAPKSLLPIMRENLERALRTHPHPRQLLRAFAKRTPGIVSGEGAIDGSDASDEKAGGEGGRMNDEHDTLEEVADEPAREPAPESPPTPYERMLVQEAGDAVVRRAKRVARKFPRVVHKNGLMTLGDLVGIGHQALYRAARAYREGVNPNFPAFAGFYVHGAMVNALDDLLFEERVKQAAAKATDNHCAHQGGDDYNVMKHDGDEARRRYRAFANGVLAATFAAGLAEAEKRLDIAELLERRDYERALVTMKTALARLEEKDRQLLALLYKDLMTLVGAGEALGIPYGTVRARHSRALKALHELLADEGIERAPRPLVVPHAGDLLEARAPPPQNDTDQDGER